VVENPELVNKPEPGRRVEVVENPELVNNPEPGRRVEVVAQPILLLVTDIELFRIAF